MNKLKQMIQYRGNSIAFALLTAFFTVVPESFFAFGCIPCSWEVSTCILVNRLIVCVVTFVVVDLGYYVYRQRRSSLTISERTYAIQIERGDLLEVKNGLKVVSFDECFTNTIGERPADVKPDSICGQFLRKHPVTDMSALIAQSGIKSDGTSKYMDKPSYRPGTIIHHGEYLLMAFATLDQDGLGRMNFDSYINCLNMLWEEIDKYHCTNDVYLPILGSRIVRFDNELTQQELLDIMIFSYRLSPHKLKLPNMLHIVYRDRDGFSINNIAGVD